MNTFKSTLKWLLWIAIFLVPLMPYIVSNQMFFPYVVPKGIYFRVMVEICLGLWLALALIDRKYYPKKPAIAFAFAVFVLLISLADALGVDPIKSIRGNYERFEGLVLIVHWFAYFWVLISACSVRQWQYLITWSSVVATFLVGFSALKTAGGNISGSLGNSSYLGVYAMLHLFIAIYFVAHFWLKKKKNELDYLAWGWWILMIPWFLYLIYRSSTLGSMLGVVGGLAITILLIAILERKHKILRITALCLVIFGLVAGIVAMIYVNRNYDTLKQRGGIVTEISTPIFVASELFRGSTKAAYDFLYGHGRARTIIWTTIAPQGVIERPWLGWGQENFSQVFAKYYNPAIYDQEQWFDRTHNVFFDWLIAGGIFGLLSYLGIFAVAIYLLWREKHRFERWEAAIFTGLIVAYFIHNIFVFDNLSSYMLIALVLAGIQIKVLNANELAPQNKAEQANSQLALPLSIIVLIIFSVLVVKFNWQIYQGNNNILRAITITRVTVPEQQHEYFTKNGVWGLISIEAMNFFKQAIGYECLEENVNWRSVSSGKQMVVCTKFDDGQEVSPYIAATEEAREQLMQNVSVFLQPYYPIEIRQQWFEFALAEFQKQIMIEPNDARNYIIFTNLAASLQQWDMAIDAMSKSLVIFPNKPTSMLSLSKLYIARWQSKKDSNDIVQAKAWVEKIIELVPDWQEAQELKVYLSEI